MRVPGISWHSSRIDIKNPSLKDDETVEQFMVDLRATITDSVRMACQAEPTYMVMGMSAETFWGGKDGAAKFEQFMMETSGLDVSTGAKAAKAALDVYGARRVGIITPYQPVGDKQVSSYGVATGWEANLEQVVDFFTQLGYDVVQIHGLRCDSATSIAHVGPEEIKEAFRKVNVEGVEALLQTGTNLAAATVAAEMEVELGKPVIAINTATVWHAYRTNGINDKLEGFGSLLSKH